MISERQTQRHSVEVCLPPTLRQSYKCSIISKLKSKNSSGKDEISNKRLKSIKRSILLNL